MRWKWVLIIVAGLMLVSLAGLFVILSRYDFNHLKPEIARVVKAATGREVIMDGDIGLKIGLAPRLTMANVSLQNAPWGSRPEMVTIKHFEVQVALLPLVRGEIEIKRFVLVEPDILIETDPAGRSNLVFEKSGEVSSAQQKGETLGSKSGPAGLQHRGD